MTVSRDSRRHGRRAVLGSALAWSLGVGLGVRAQTAPRGTPLDPTHAAAVDLLLAGGVVAAFRHALAPGTYDPPGFRVDDCSTQRNLDDVGRAQARRLGAWFRDQRLEPVAVRSSPWCRCLDTARLAFGRVDAWEPLSSPVASDDSETQRRLDALRARLAEIPPGRFEVWVSHQFTLSRLAGRSLSSGEGIILRANGGAAEVAGRLPAS